jgi:hypothetical protein
VDVRIEEVPASYYINFNSFLTKIFRQFYYYKVERLLAREKHETKKKEDQFLCSPKRISECGQCTTSVGGYTRLDNIQS